MIQSYIKREYYINKILPFVDKTIIKVIVGQRRVGKSYLMYQLIDHIKEINPKANIIYINKEQYEFDFIDDYKDLLKYIYEKTKKNQKNYLFIDEIQDIKKFEKTLRDLGALENYDIYCSGSNANLLSGELATYLSGRYIEFPIYSLCYLEFLKFHELQNNQDSLLKYIKYGGMPYLKNLELNDNVTYDYLKSIYNTIILKDIVTRHKIRNIDFLNRLIEFLADNLGSLISAKKISDFLKSQRMPLSPSIVLNYLSYLCSAFFIFKTRRMDIHGKKIFEVNEKYYFEDLGLRHSLIGYRSVDINKILENLIYSQLKTFGYKIYVGQLGSKEIDFIAEKDGEKLYVQSAYLISDEKVKEREFGNLLSIKDNYPKIVVSMNEITGGKYKGIENINILEFLSRETYL